MIDQPFRSDRRVITWLLFGLLLLFGGLYVAGYVFTSDRVPRGTTVSGVDIGGLRPAAARTALEREVEELRSAPIRVKANGKRGKIQPDQAGLDVDVLASVNQAGAGRSWDPARMWDSLTGGGDYEVVTTVDEDALSMAVLQFANKADRPARDGGVRFVGDTARPVKPRDGLVIDQDAAVDEVAAAYADPDERAGQIELPTRVVEPDIDKDDVSAAMKEFANPAVSGPVYVELDDERVSIEPADFVPALTMTARGGVLEPELDEDALVERVAPLIDTGARAAKDATVRIVKGRPKVIPGEKGVTFDKHELTAGFLPVLSEEGEARRLRVGTRVTKPEFKTKDARLLLVTEKVSEFTTYFPHSDYRNTNLGRAAKLINNTLLKPGDVFSLNQTVGERTAENGFTKGYIISDGVYKEDYGGGVSQVATTTFNAMFFAGLKDVEHKPHSFYIDRYPVGREATVAWPSVDLKFKNNSRFGVLVQAWIDPSSPKKSGAMHVRMWSKKHWRIKAGKSAKYNPTEPETRYLSGDDCVPHEGYGGFDIDVYRYFYRPGSKKLHHKETFTTRYTPSDTVVCEDS